MNFEIWKESVLVVRQGYRLVEHLPNNFFEL